MSSMLPEEREHLTTGWEDDLSPADSLVRQAVLAHVSWARALTAAARGEFSEGPSWCAGRGGGVSALLNWAIVTSPPRDWEQTVGQLWAAYPEGVSSIVISPFPTPDLTTHGLALVGHPPLMFRPTSTVTPAPSSSLDVREATTEQHLQDAERVLVEGYPMPDMADLPPGDFYRPDVVDGPTKVFVGYDGDTPVATAAAHAAAGVTSSRTSRCSPRPVARAPAPPSRGQRRPPGPSRAPSSLRATTASPSTSGSATCGSSAGPAGCAPDAPTRRLPSDWISSGGPRQRASSANGRWHSRGSQTKVHQRSTSPGDDRLRSVRLGELLTVEGAPSARRVADFVGNPDEDTAAGGGLVALIGVDDLVVVDTQDALLITAPERAKQDEQILEPLTAQGRLDLT